MKAVCLILAYFLFLPFAHGQDSLQNTPLTLSAAFQLALNNSEQLRVGRTRTLLAKQQTEIEKLARLPNLSTGFDYGYLSNADVWKPDFSNHTKGGIPHPLTLLSVEASELVFKGNQVNNNIHKSTLEEQVAFLRVEKDDVDVKFLVAAGYLDIYRLLNQRNVYINNTRLARERLKNIQSLRRQGIVTQNDVLRTELIVSDYELTVRKIGNSVAQLNNQLNIILGLPDTSRLKPDTTLLRQAVPVRSLDAFLDEAYRENHELKISAKENEIAETNIKLLRGERMPAVALVAASNLQRPFLTSLPPTDVYYNIYRAGISIRYNLSSIYQSPRKIKAGTIGLDLSHQRDSLQRQVIEVGVRNAFIKYNESQDELQTYRSDLKSAEENYRNVEKRYFNQLALLTDLIDATNTKTEAEIRVTNAEINTIYTYYQLLKAIGSL
ncbi:MAG: TolC family protein [Bacteroidetes bacterium]|nr:TolC family protein [Bacteroidota bacterium]